MNADNEHNSRRNFLKLGFLTGGSLLAGAALTSALKADEQTGGGEKVKVLTADGRLVEVDSSQVAHPAESKLNEFKIREGIEGRRFVMVIDLAKCANARKCIEGCQKMHSLLPPIELIKVKRMQDSDLGAPYWMPQMCFQCDNPPCTKVCPVDATFKRSDGIVYVDNDRCVGCKFCMAACPYSARTFNFGRPQQQAFFDEHRKDDDMCCSTDLAATVGTVSKCDFCPDHAAMGKLPSCVTDCPNGVILFGDENEDTVTNGENTYRLRELLMKRAGYRLFEELGTKPRVYYLPPVNREFPFEEDTVAHNTEE